MPGADESLSVSVLAFREGEVWVAQCIECDISTLQKDFVDTWSGAYLNDRAAFGVGQVYCNPDDPKPGALNPDPMGRNNFANGSYIIKLLFSTVTEAQLPIVKGALTWQGHVFVNDDPTWRNKGPISRFERALGPIRLIQIDVSVRDDHDDCANDNKDARCSLDHR